jgi:hydroxyethylthiazole kinase
VSLDVERIATLPERLRERAPRVHCLLNTVAQLRVADGLSALGGVPSMTASPDEVAHFAKRADALLVNLGTSTPAMREAILLGIEAAREAGRPFVLDPVKSHASPVRHNFALRLLQLRPFAVKANAAEVADLEPEAGNGTLVIETGETDRIADGARTIFVHNGHPWLAAVTATGCLAGAILAAAAAVEPEPLHAGAGAMAVLGIAAEIAGENARGPGSFAGELLDALANLGAADIRSRLRWSDV